MAHPLLKRGVISRHPIRHDWGIVVQAQAATAHLVRLRIALDASPLMFSPGQYIQLAFEGWAARAYVLANRPGDPLLEVHIQRVPGGMVSEHAVDSVREGARVKVDGPYGEPLLQDESSAPMVMIAGGWGMAAIKSVLLATLARSRKDIPALHVYHGVEHAQDLYDAHIVSSAWIGAVRYVPVVATPSLEIRCRHGSVQDAVESDFESLQGFAVYVAGPAAMVAACAAAASRLGVDPGDLHTEAFDAPVETDAMPIRTRARLGLLRALLG